MKKILIIFLLFFISAQLIYAEGFIKSYRNTILLANWNSDTEAMVVAPNDDIVIAGSYDGHGHVIRIDSDGNIIWHKRYKYWSTYFNDIKATPDNGFIVVGYTDSENDDEGILIKIDSMGNVSWEKSYGGAGIERFHAVSITSDGGFIVAGRTNSFAQYGGVWILKLDSNGNILWEKVFDNIGGAFDLFETDDGYFVGGGLYDYWFIKLDFSGNVIFEKKFGGIEDDELYSVVPTDDGFIAAGTGYDLPWIGRFYSNGSIIWEKAYGRVGFATKIIPTMDGNFVFTAEIDSHIKDDRDILIAKINPDGDLLFQKRIGGPYNELNPSLGENSVGDIIVAAKTNSFCLDDNNSFMVAKLNSSGDVGGCGFIEDMNLPFGITHGEFSAISVNSNDTSCNVTEIPTIIDYQDTYVEDVCPGDILIDCDDDTIHDPIDNCPFHSNPLQEDSYPPGGNGIGDACDCEGNFDGDQDIDGGDAAYFKMDFGRSSYKNPCTSDWLCNGDFNCDGDVDGSDAAVFKGDFGRSPFYRPCRFYYEGEWCVYP